MLPRRTTATHRLSPTFDCLSTVPPCQLSSYSTATATQQPTIGRKSSKFRVSLNIDAGKFGGSLLRRRIRFAIAATVACASAAVTRCNSESPRPFRRPRSACRVRVEGSRIRQSSSGSTAWPPNSLRSAAIIFIAGESSWRETKRAKSAAEMAGTGTARSIADWTVQRPSPESSA